MITYQGGVQLDALGDPRRREIVALLSQEPASVGTLAERLPISRPAVSQHLGILKTADLVQVRAEGTRRVYSLDPAGIAEVRAFLETFWREDLQQFAAYVEQQARTADQADKDIR
ncbi:ArsR/SmtB family transcription factor [Nesterenkonia ebinurensis]|uniref:ArsR/SmtB family transcription factor n=1 Tax=Nesterenkonia ebinurensis TaxID=2608252 RepID=UPI00168B7D12|nr:metalloregulator ArsR/SmtB family transcription factor [Nesterenkonia ebinurensis]